MWPEPHNTAEILKKITAGDAAAVNDLFNRHRAGLRKMIDLRMDRRMAGRLDASDVVQDVLSEAHGRLAEYLRDGRMPFHVWLRQLALDRMIDLHRRHHARRRDVANERPMTIPAMGDRSSLDLAAELRDAELTPAAAAIRQELQERFHQALDQMPDDDREILLLRHQEQMGNGEAADALGLSPAAAGMRYLRALRRLREILTEPTSSQ